MITWSVASTLLSFKVSELFSLTSVSSVTAAHSASEFFTGVAVTVNVVFRTAP